MVLEISLFFPSQDSSNHSLPPGLGRWCHSQSQGPPLSQVAFQEHPPPTSWEEAASLSLPPTAQPDCPCCHARVRCGGAGVRRCDAGSRVRARPAEPACTWLLAASRWRCCSPHGVWAHEGTPDWVPAPNTLFLHRPLVDAEHLRRLPHSLAC